MEIVKVLDPRLQFATSNTLLALSGSSSINAIQYVVNGGNSDSNLVIQCNPASERVAVDSNVLLHMSFSITLSGTNTSTQPLAISSMVAPSFMPLSQIKTSESMTINGTAANIQNSNIFMPALLSTYDAHPCVLNGEYSTTPCMPDASTEFLQLPASATSIRNPLAGVYDQTYMTPRGAFTGFNQVSNVAGGTTATFTLDCAEPILVSPFAFGKGSYEAIALTSINNLLYNATLANLNRVISIAYPLVGGVPTYTPLDASGTIAITNVVVHVTRAELMFTNFSLYQDVPRPMKSVTTFNQVIDYNTTNAASMAPATSSTLTLASVVLGSVPRSLYIFVPCMPDSFTQQSLPSACTIPVAFLQAAGGASGFLGNTDFHPLSIVFDNQSCLQNYTIFDLYKISKKNGCNQDFSDFVGMPQQYPYSTGRGMVLKLNFGEDIPLSDGICVGTTGKYSLTVQLTVYNQTQRTLPSTTLHCVAIYDGIQTTSDNTITVNHQASFTPEQVAATPINPTIKFKPVRRVFGGSFWDTLKGAFGSVNNFLKDHKIISTIASQFGPTGQKVGDVARSLGYGCDGGSRKGQYRRRPRARAGGAIDEEEEENYE